jgi:hypothetical protein
MNVGRWAAITVVSAAIAAVVASSSAWTVAWPRPSSSELRLSWSARPERIETCRALSADEQAARPVHMRVTEECSGTTATYQLVVVLDGRVLEDTVIRGSGVRHDRPIFLLRRYPVEEGEHRVEVRVQRREPVYAVRDSAAVSADRFARALVMDTTLTFASGRAALVTYDRGALLVADR